MLHWKFIKSSWRREPEANPEEREPNLSVKCLFLLLCDICHTPWEEHPWVILGTLNGVFMGKTGSNNEEIE